MAVDFTAAIAARQVATAALERLSEVLATDEIQDGLAVVLVAPECPYGAI